MRPVPSHEVQPAHFVLMSAFCCSSLLARHLNSLPNSHVVNEPDRLSQISAARSIAERCDGNTVDEWRLTLQAVVEEIAAASPPSTITIVKCSDLVNAAADLLPTLLPASRFALLCIPPLEFIFATLKDNHRIQWCRSRARFWRASGLFRRYDSLQNVDIDALDDCKLGAYLWLCANLSWLPLRCDAAPERLMLIDGSVIARASANHLDSIHRFFGLNVTLPARTMSGSVWEQHAKDPSRPFDNGRRTQELAERALTYSAQAKSAIIWLGSLVSHYGITITDAPFVQ